MSHAKRKRRSLVRDIYYTMFLLCCQFTYYDGAAEAYAAAALVTMLMSLLFYTLCIWAELATGLPLTNPWVFVSAFVIGYLNYSLFLRGKRGDKFNDEFSEYSALKQNLLSIAAILTAVAILVGTILSAIAYRHAHGLSA